MSAVAVVGVVIYVHILAVSFFSFFCDFSCDLGGRYFFQFVLFRFFMYNSLVQIILLFSGRSVVSVVCFHLF